MQKYINAELYDNDSLYYVQLYFSNLIFVLKPHITRNSKLNLDLLYQLTKILYVCNPFINKYKIAAEQIQSSATNTVEEICVIVNA